MNKAIALVDCNSFFCSCERVFRPDLKNTPIVVLSNNDGCIISRTNEAKALNIPMGVPYFKIRDLCREKKVAVFSANFPLYADMSIRVMSKLKELAPLVQVYSIDEAFVDLTGVQNLDEKAREMRDEIYRCQKIPTGVGVAPTKVLAKLANAIAKTSARANGVVNLMDKKWQDYALKTFPIEEVWGVGRRSALKMHSLGIKTALDLRDFKNEAHIQKMFTKVGLQIKHELMGINCLSLETVEKDKRELTSSRSFGNSVYTLEELKEAIAFHITVVAERLRNQKESCRSLSIYASTSRFKEEAGVSFYERIDFSDPTSDTFKLINAAFKKMEEKFQPGFAYRKAGVGISDFVKNDEIQLDLFLTGDDAKSIAKMQVMDIINYQEGKGTLQSAALSSKDARWHSLQLYKSPRFTTSWNDLKVFL